MNRALRTLLVVACTTGAVLSSLTVAASQDGTSRTPASAKPLDGMRILVSNDDSMQAAKASNADGLGLYELRKALCDAGADVVVMAPWQVQSGKGTAVTNGGTLTLAKRIQLPAGYENDCSGTPSGSPVYGICLSAVPCGPDSASATPSDTVKFALRTGLAAKAGWQDGPDLVVTGINSGPNVSAQVNDSGTVGAAIAAIDQGVPAVALSSSGDASQMRFPVANYRAHARFAAGFVAGLRARDLFTDRFALKVDYPDVSAGQRAKAPTWTKVGHGQVVWHAYEAKSGGDQDSYDIAMGLCPGRPGDPCTETVPDADSTALLERGHITVAPITADRTYGVRTDGGRELRRIEQYVTRYAPRS
ncbi:5'/3'-nucleotidase SurE [Streptomyces sp. TRM66268-LWL]|uniref:5'-nucleotidase n=1 Tax=Streptomyces polyasparticus TaxID=2767826 RepID=A0ABR7S9J1_9ACTN|nr:5'/3'-nucleotidase SurE [Streptomyces polyasparticus]MBC9711008.1 5'/3'-nucleotidase SurE [Streptomyces polyasparticus]